MEQRRQSENLMKNLWEIQSKEHAGLPWTTSSSSPAIGVVAHHFEGCTNMNPTVLSDGRVSSAAPISWHPWHPHVGRHQVHVDPQRRHMQVCANVAAHASSRRLKLVRPHQNLRFIAGRPRRQMEYLAQCWESFQTIWRALVV